MSRNEKPETFGQRLRALRHIMGLSQEKLGERAGLAREVVNKIESGRNKARSARIQHALARGLDLPPVLFDAFYEGKLDAQEVTIQKHGELTNMFGGMFPGQWSASTWAAVVFAGLGTTRGSDDDLIAMLDGVEKALRKTLGVKRLVHWEKSAPVPRGSLLNAVIDREWQDRSAGPIATQRIEKPPVERVRKAKG